MAQQLVHLKRSRLPILIALCVAALTATSVFADSGRRPLYLQVIGDPDAAVNGKFTVGSSSSGAKALNVIGTIDFQGIGTVHNYFTQGPGNNMQINSNVDDTNAVGDATKSQWKLMLGSSLNQFSIRRSPAGASYNEDALFFINGSNGRVAIATVDTSNMAVIPFTPEARLHVESSSEDAIWGINMSTSGGATGVYGETSATDGHGVFGYAAATTGFAIGVNGQSDSTDGVGVNGYASATTGFANGVFGQTDSTDGVGVFGFANSTTGFATGVVGVGDATGVFGQADSTDGTGVFGGAFATSGLNFGVYGFSNSPAGYAGWFDGDVNVNGTLTKSAGGFRIDHPLDPSGMYLSHSFVESPDMKNLYDGVVILDVNGEASVELPEWFEALNMDFRYQLTPIGEAMPNLHIAQEIEGNRFKIAGGIAEMKASWQVTGIRHDPFAEANRIQVEVQKPAEEQGAFLAPELYGQSLEGGLQGGGHRRRDQ